VLPGIGPIATIAMLLPITFGLGPLSSLIMLAGIFYGAIWRLNYVDPG
jgi:TctA family transporter